MTGKYFFKLKNNMKINMYIAILLCIAYHFLWKGVNKCSRVFASSGTMGKHSQNCIFQINF
jgi:hypothetical protein